MEDKNEVRRILNEAVGLPANATETEYQKRLEEIQAYRELAESLGINAPKNDRIPSKQKVLSQKEIAIRALLNEAVGLPADATEAEYEKALNEQINRKHSKSR